MRINTKSKIKIYNKIKSSNNTKMDIMSALHQQYSDKMIIRLKDIKDNIIISKNSIKNNET